MDDVLIGQGGVDRISGRAGADRLEGNGGNDQLNGEAGSDELIGGAGNDYLTGGAGSDRFSFSSPTDGIDTITDFNASEDLIKVSINGFGGDLSVGQLDSSQVTLGSLASTNDHRFIYNDANGDLLFDSDGNGLASAIQFATLDPNLALTHQHFVLV